MKIFSKEMSFESVDKKRWWCLVLNMIIGCAVAFTYMLSPFVEPLHQTYGWDPSKIVFIYTLTMWLGTPFVIIGGILRDKIGAKVVILFCSILYGVSMILSGLIESELWFVIMQGVVVAFFFMIPSTPQAALVGELFPDRRGFTLGLMSAGLTLGPAWVAPGVTALMGHFSPLTTVVICGVVLGAIATICSFLIFEAPEGYLPKAMREAPNEVLDDMVAITGPQVPWLKMIRTPMFWCLFITFICVALGGNMVTANGAFIAEVGFGIAPMKSAFIFSAIGTGCAIGSIVFGFVLDKLGSGITLAIIAALTCLGAILTSVFGTGNAALVTVALTAMGFASGGMMSAMTAITMNVFGDRHFGINFGVMGVNVMVVSFFAPRLSVMDNIKMAFLIVAAVALAGVILSLIERKMERSFILKNSETQKTSVSAMEGEA